MCDKIYLDNECLRCRDINCPCSLVNFQDPDIAKLHSTEKSDYDQLHETLSTLEVENSTYDNEANSFTFEFKLPTNLRNNIVDIEEIISYDGDLCFRESIEKNNNLPDFNNIEHRFHYQSNGDVYLLLEYFISA